MEVLNVRPTRLIVAARIWLTYHDWSCVSKVSGNPRIYKVQKTILRDVYELIGSMSVVVEIEAFSIVPCTGTIDNLKKAKVLNYQIQIGLPLSQVENYWKVIERTKVVHSFSLSLSPILAHSSTTQILREINSVRRSHIFDRQGSLTKQKIRWVI